MDIIQNAEDFVFNLLKDALPDSYTYHNFNHTQKVVSTSQLLIQHENLDNDEAEAILLAAWFHDAGYINGPQNHESQSVLIAENFLKKT